MDTKQELETNKAALELLISESGDKCIDYKAQIAQIEKDLKDLGKIALPSVVFDDIYEAIEEALGEYDFSDSDNYDTEFELDYDNKVTLSELELCNHQYLVEMIVEKISKLFVETIDDEEGNKGPGNE